MNIEDIEYRVERLRRRLAEGASGELGLRIEARPHAVTVSGTVADAACREEVLRAVAHELAGLAVLVDVTVAPAANAVHPVAEEL